MEFDLLGFTVENLRGFSKTHLSLNRPVTLLVGPNNSGKTSLLRMLEWSLNGVDLELLHGRRERRPDEDALLLPARNSHSRARRLTLHVFIRDGRRRSKFRANKGVAKLRLRIVGTGAYAAVSDPTRSEPKESEAAAVDLWRELHDEILVLHVPAARDASSDRFKETLATAIRARLEERAIHDVRGGAPSEYRAIKSAVDQIRQVGDELVEPLWRELAHRLPAGLVRAGQFSFDAAPPEMVNWLIECADFRISTGEHDERSVNPGEVGSGLQSLLDLALLESVEDLAATSWLLLEEPEAFLHPSAQRQVAQSVLADRSVRRVVSTHAPIVVDEARYGQVVLLRDHQIFEPTLQDDRREEINSALMAGGGAEAIFSESVLFVEGPGDRAFFHSLRQRLAAKDSTGCVHRLGIVAVGGSTRFAPWIRLMQSYADRQGELPIRWLAIADAADAATRLAKGFRDAGLTIPQQVSDLLRDLPKAVGRDHLSGVARTRELNEEAALQNVRMALLPVDLEFAMLEKASQGTVRELGARFGAECSTASELMKWLGSKVGGKVVNNPSKAEWIRAECGLRIPPDEISSDVLTVLSRWLEGVVEPDQAEALVASIE